jgi:phosphatidylglycerophosphate synthase
MRARDKAQQIIYKIINPFVKLLIKIGVTPNGVTTIGLLINILAAVVFIIGGEYGELGDLSYIGWGCGLILFAGLFDMLDGQVARLGSMSSRFGALYDSVLDRYSELIMFFGICYYFVSHHYFISSMFAFAALIGSMMVSYVRARAEGLGIECKGGLMQRPERVVMIGLSGLICGIVSACSGGNQKFYVNGSFDLIETISIFTIPIAIVAILSNITAIKRLNHSRKHLNTPQV